MRSVTNRSPLSEPATEVDPLILRCDSERAEEFRNYNHSLPKGHILFTLWMGSFLSSIDGTIVANIMNKIAEEFHESNEKQRIATSFLLTNTVFQPLYGRLSDITGRKFSLLTAHLFFGTGCLFTSLSRNLTQFALARAVCGMGSGGISSLSSIVVSDIVTSKERGLYQGYANIVYATGSILGGPIGGLFIEYIGWRFLFAIQVPLIATCSFLASRFIKIKLTHIPPRQERFTRGNLAKIDLPGSSTLACIICGVLLMCSKTDISKLFLFLFTFLSSLAFTYIELYVAKVQIMPFNLLKETRAILASIITLVGSFVVFGEIFRTPIYLQVVQDLSVTASGLFMILPSASTALGSVFAGWLLRKTTLNLSYCSSLINLLGICLQLVGSTLSCCIVYYWGPYLGDIAPPGGYRTLFTLLLMSASILTSFGYANILVATLVNIVSVYGSSRQATMTGIFYLWRSIGNVLGSSMTLIVFDNSLDKFLRDFLLGNKNIDNEFTEDDYRTLLSDSGYLRSGRFHTAILRKLLDVYRNSFLVSYVPSASLLMITIIVASYLVKLYRVKEGKDIATTNGSRIINQ